MHLVETGAGVAQGVMKTTPRKFDASVIECRKSGDRINASGSAWQGTIAPLSCWSVFQGGIDFFPLFCIINRTCGGTSPEQRRVGMQLFLRKFFRVWTAWFRGKQGGNSSSASRLSIPLRIFRLLAVTVAALALAACRVEVSPESFSLSADAGDQVAETLTITNPGDEPVEFLLQPTDTEISLSGTTGTLEPGAETEITVSMSCSGTQGVTGAIRVASSVGNKSSTSLFTASSRGGYLSLEPLMRPKTVVIFLERVQLSFEVVGVPKWRLVEIFAPDRSNQTFHEWV